MPIRVLNNYVLILPEERQMKDGLLLPDTVKDKEKKQTQRGTVIGVGPGGVLPSGKRLPLSVKVGDKVFMDVSKCRGLFDDDGRFLALCQEDAIMGVRE